MIYKKYLYLTAKILVGFVGLLAAINLVLATIHKLNWPQIVDGGTYQAVFLDNNQIYFGHLKNIDSLYLLLKDVYYVQLSDGHNAKTGRLVKLGEAESHGPRDEMIINRQHVLFWENLTSSSQIVRTIQVLKGQK